MLKSKADVLERIKPFELPAPEPLSHIPSVAIRQAIADVERLTGLGVTLNMNEWGSVNGQCNVCLAGAVLLSRGYYRDNINRNIAKYGDQPKYVYASDDDALRQYGSDSYACDLAGGCKVDLATTEMWVDDKDADGISDAFDGLRKGQFAKLLRRHPDLIDEAGDLTYDGLELRDAVRDNFFFFANRLDEEEIKRLIETLNGVADFLEQKGY